MHYHAMIVFVTAFTLWIPVCCVFLITQTLISRPRKGSRRQAEELEILEWNNRRLHRMHRFNRAYQRRRRA